MSAPAPTSARGGFLLELLEAVDEAPNAVGAAVEVRSAAEADPNHHCVMAAGVADVVEVEDLAGLGVDLR